LPGQLQARAVDRAKAMTKEIGGKTCNFCSSHCMDAFEREPGPEHNPADGPEVTHAR
jgi:YHS domain-containing protein